MLVFVGSNSSTSINEQLTKSVLKEFNVDHEFIDIKKLNIPLFSEDLEKEMGSPDGIKLLMERINSHEHIFITTNEHNQNLSAFLKNVLDWLSRIELKFLTNRKVFILSTSEGRRGALGANESLQKLVVRFGCEIYEWFAFPSFNENFDRDNQRILNQEYSDEILMKLTRVLNE